MSEMQIQELRRVFLGLADAIVYRRLTGESKKQVRMSWRTKMKKRAL